MNISVEQLIVFLIFLSSLVFLRLSGFRFLGANSHPLSFLIITQIFTLTLIGTVALGVFGLPMSYNADLSISMENRENVVLLVFSSAAVLVWGLACLFGLKVITPLGFEIREGDVSLLKKLTFISAAVLVLKLFSVSEIPLLHVIRGDSLAAAEAKVRILTNQTGITFFGANYIFRSFTSCVYLASVFALSFDGRNNKIRIIFLINIFLALINSLYDVQKQTVVLLALATFWIFYIRKGKAGVLIKGAIVSTILIGAMFVFTLDYSLDESLIDDAVHRVFLAQAEGMFFIREFITPSIEYLWLGMPLASLFGLEQLDPAAQVVKILFPNAGDSWLNSNTYFITHAWSIFGNWAVLIGPFFVLLNVFSMLFVGQILVRKRPAIFYPVLFWFIIKMPLANIFTEFLWMKVSLDYFINVIFVYILFFIFRGRSRENPEKSRPIC